MPGKRGVGKKLNALEKKVSQMQNQKEEHELNTAFAGVYATQNNVPTYRNLTAIGQGTDFDARVGRLITLKSIRLSFLLRGPMLSAAGATPPVPYRIIVYQDMGYDGTNRPPTEILEDYSAVASTYNNYMSHFNDDFVITDKTNKHNPVKILKDIRGQLVQTASGYGNCFKTLTFTVRGLKKMQFSGVGSADGKAGSVFALIFMGPDNVQSNNNSYCLLTSTRFLDD